MAVTDIGRMRAHVTAQKDRERHMMECASQHRQMMQIPAQQEYLKWLQKTIDDLNGSWTTVRSLEELNVLKGRIEGLTEALRYIEKYLNYEQPTATA